MPESTNPRLPPEKLAKLHFYGFYEEPSREYGPPPREYRPPPREYGQQPSGYEAPPREYREWARQEAEEQARQEAEERARRQAEERVLPPGYEWRPYEKKSLARSTRRLWLIVVPLAVLVALVVLAFLLRG